MNSLQIYVNQNSQAQVRSYELLNSLGKKEKQI